MSIKKTIVLASVLASCPASAELIATSSEPVILGISDLVVELHDTKPNNPMCKGRSGFHQANFYFFFRGEKRKKEIATGCWIENNEKVSLFGTKLETGEKFNYDQAISAYEIIKPLEVVRGKKSAPGEIDKSVASGSNEIPKPHQIAFSGDFVKYPKGATQATLERYIPGIQCQEFMGSVMCVSKPNSLSTMFIRGITCDQTSEVMFTLEQGKTVGATCGIDGETAESLSLKYTKKYGAPKKERKQVDSMFSNHQTWIIGRESHVISHWGGSNINGDPLNKYNISISEK